MTLFKKQPFHFEPLEARRLLSATYTITDLGVLSSSYGTSTAEAISANGTVVGFDTRGTGINQRFRAFEYINGKMVDLGTLSGDTSSRAFGISDAGFIAGASINDLQGSLYGSHAVLFSNGKVIQLREPLGGFPGSTAADVNADGQAVGADHISDPPYSQNGFVSTGTNIQDIPNTSRGQATAINDHGTVIGNFVSFRGGHLTNGFFVYANGQETEILHGTDATYAGGINQRGDIVGLYFPSPASPGTTFIYSNGVFHPFAGTGFFTDWGATLGSFTDPSALLPAGNGWTFDQNFGIYSNDAGQLTGTAYHHGVQRAFLMNPIMPAASISGTIFNDSNGDGIQQKGEPGLKGWYAFIDFNNNGVFDGTDIRGYSDATGHYSFRGVPAGTYHISQAVPKGWRRTNPLMPGGYTVTIAAGQQLTGNNFAYQQSSFEKAEIVGPPPYIRNDQGLNYQIKFQNDPTAPASVVTVTQQLDSTLDWSTFQLGDIHLGTTTISVPAGLQHFTTSFSVNSALRVDIDANLDSLTGTGTWKFTSIDPTTGLPPGTSNANSPLNAPGFVTYSAIATAGSLSGTVVTSQAFVIFDNRAADSTSRFFSTVDAIAPTSHITSSGQTGPDGIPFSWSGTDDPNGSGISQYTIFISDNGGSYFPWLQTSATSAIYHGVPGHTYSFYTQAVDQAGNIENDTPQPQSETIPLPIHTIIFTNLQRGRYLDTAGNAVIATLYGPGTATLSFSGDGNSDPASITLDGTTARSSILFRVARGNALLSNILINGSLNIFRAVGFSLSGSFVAAGTLASLAFSTVAGGGANISVRGSAVPTSYFIVGAVHDLAINSVSAIRTISALSWTDDASLNNSITAPSLGYLRIGGDFNSNLFLTSAATGFATVYIRGTITGGTWTIAGSGGRIVAGSIGYAWGATFAGSLASLLVYHNASGSFTAASLHAMGVGGDFTHATYTLVGPAIPKRPAFGALVVRGTLDYVGIIATGDIQAISVGGATSSFIFADVYPGTQGLPGPGDLIVPATIGSFISTGRMKFDNTNIAAGNIGLVALSDVVLVNDIGAPFGIETHLLNRFYLLRTLPKAFAWNRRLPVSQLQQLPADLQVKVN